jgi:exodeoxyribonuclease VII small subunit
MKKNDFRTTLEKLEEIRTWFQNDSIDLDEGLKKLKEGKELIDIARSRLQEVENQFIEIKKEYEVAEVQFTQDVKPLETDEPRTEPKTTAGSALDNNTNLDDQDDYEDDLPF